ncbi:Nicotianamine synthase [Delitschia confertaspora ATCC 74209]|uniref:Nicotianamine synthase n=1 Tax=Delitschia confertaspora ATCC 74209 TaxID=1513339 RepID=A0A9P4JKW7_9PLEO|nr:Nicotianamine synthase [Delitschia confertaspora ATCC 74209]
MATPTANSSEKATKKISLKKPIPPLSLSLLTQTPPRTPSPTSPLSSKEEELAVEIRTIHQTLAAHQHDLRPCPTVNVLLTNLVELCVTPRNDTSARLVLAYLEEEELADLRRWCGIAEGKLERKWAREMAALCGLKNEQETPSSPARQSILYSFPYYENYLDLARLEHSILSSFLPLPSPSCSSSAKIENIAFIGSGPLPLTSFCLADLLGKTERDKAWRIWNVDRDAEALSLSSALATRLGYDSETMVFVNDEVGGGDEEAEDREQGVKWEDMNVIFLAALVGLNNAAKLTILRELVTQLKPGTLVLARSARGLREVLYPVLELNSAIEDMGFEVLAEVHPWTKVVNSVVVLRVK